MVSQSKSSPSLCPLTAPHGRPDPQALVIFPLTLWAGWITEAFLLNTASLVRVCGELPHSLGPRTHPAGVTLWCARALDDDAVCGWTRAGGDSFEYDRPNQVACVIFTAAAGIFAASLVVTFKGCPWCAGQPKAQARVQECRRAAYRAVKQLSRPGVACCVVRCFTRYTLGILWGFLAMAVTSCRPGARYVALGAGACAQALAARTYPAGFYVEAG